MKRLLPSRHLRRSESGEGFFSFILILATFLVIAFVIRQAKDATRPEAITAARAEVRVKNLAGVEQSAQETLGTYAWQDEDKGYSSCLDGIVPRHVEADDKGQQSCSTLKYY